MVVLDAEVMQPCSTATLSNNDNNNRASSFSYAVDEMTCELHQAVFDNNLKRLASLLKRSSTAVEERDLFGNTALHIAVMLGRRECASLLLTYGAPVKARNNYGWNALAEAISYGSRHTIALLLRKLKEQSREAIRRRKPDMLRALEQMQDFYLELKWDFQTWIPLLSRALPSDVCRIYKRGSFVRLDTTLVDFSEQAWQRGDVTFLFDAAQNVLLILDNKAQVYQRADYEESEADIENEVDLLMSSDVVSAQLQTKDIEFVRAHEGLWWFRHDKTSKVGAYTAEHYDLHGLQMVTRKRREHLSSEDVAANRAFMKHLKLISTNQHHDVQSTEFKDTNANIVHGRHRPSLPSPSSNIETWEEYISHDPTTGPPVIAREPVCKHGCTSLKASIAMSDDFPLQVSHLLDILEIVAPFKHLRKLRDVVQTRLPPGFPVRVEVPLLATISAVVTFADFRFESNLRDSLFEIPIGYREDPSRFPNL